ncbi:MAG: hypothetical protein OXI60_00680 [Acidiferrobacterales bacterium]|nr:hypothetical protein [Acidiferrobacterales bacterium]
MSKLKFVAICVVFLFGGSANAQSVPSLYGIFGNGNCWLEGRYILYCSNSAPAFHELADEFALFRCFERGQIVMLRHLEAATETEVRTISWDMNARKDTSTWMVLDERASFIPSPIGQLSPVYVGLVAGLADPNTKQFSFTIESANVEGSIALTGEEYRVICKYVANCAELEN